MLLKANHAQGFHGLGIQTGPFAACEANLVLKFFQFLTLMLGSANSLLPQRAENEKKGFSQKWMRHRGFGAWGIQTEPFAAG